ncbi:MAG: PAC2 family protein [Candidatus Omnitrophica bacterium]|nr:PAC2 family protein [Candidatus Omnitrophota bacterium]
MEGITVLKRPRMKNPCLVVAWPGMGEVAYKAATYMVDQLKAEEFARILPEDFFYLTGSDIQEGVLTVPELPKSSFYYWRNPQLRRSAGIPFSPKSDARDLIIFVSNAQPDLARADIYSKRILQVAKMFGVDTVISFASMPQPIDHTQESGVWGASTSTELNSTLRKFNFRILNEGQISGMNGLFLGLAKKEGFKGFCLLGEIPLYTIQIENPRAALAVLGAFSKVFNIRFDFSALVEQIHTMEGEINRMLEYLKLGAQGHSGPIGEEEIERIKKTLSQLTKLPHSVKDKIDKLFESTKVDISKAHELKAELDKWNVYKDYEDKFLDLFKRNKGKGN